MTVNINDLADLVIDKFKSSGGYMETGEKRMRESVIRYLSKIYRYDLEYAIMKLEHDKVNGKESAKEDYVREIRKVEDNLLIQAELIAVSSKEELENFI